MDNPFTWDNLTRTPAAADIFSLPAIIFFVVFAIGFVAAAFLSNQGARRFGTNPVKRRGIQHCATIALYVFGAGLFFFGVRALNINPFSFGAPIWLWLSVLALIVLAVYCIWYWKFVYPERLAAYEARQLKQQYLKSPKRGTAKAPLTKSATPQQRTKAPPAS
jgi:hypothetical protein